ncbi:hypothetical protein [Rahnella sp. ChDrAdgB13]|nr:hypothetical protein [Rahnella sp. ChDrAdgB13]
MSDITQTSATAAEPALSGKIIFTLAAGAGLSVASIYCGVVIILILIE